MAPYFHHIYGLIFSSYQKGRKNEIESLFYIGFFIFAWYFLLWIKQFFAIVLQRNKRFEKQTWTDLILASLNRHEFHLFQVIWWAIKPCPQYIPWSCLINAIHNDDKSLKML